MDDEELTDAIEEVNRLHMMYTQEKDHHNLHNVALAVKIVDEILVKRAWMIAQGVTSG